MRGRSLRGGTEPAGRVNHGSGGRIIALQPSDTRPFWPLWWHITSKRPSGIYTTWSRKDEHHEVPAEPKDDGHNYGAIMAQRDLPGGDDPHSFLREPGVPILPSWGIPWGFA
jgi:hypothetical protein